MHMHARPIGLLVACLLIGSLAGCGGRKFTPQRYDTVYIGQPAWAVERALGAADERSPERWIYLHSKPYYRATITFQNGQVSEKHWTYLRPDDEPLPR